MTKVVDRNKTTPRLEVENLMKGLQYPLNRGKKRSWLIRWFYNVVIT